MNKKLISKCCHSEVSESVYFTCLKCDQVCEVIELEQAIKSSLQSQRQSILEEIEKKILELIAYSSFDVSYCGEVKDRNCTVEEAMSQLSKDVERLLKDNIEIEKKFLK